MITYKHLNRTKHETRGDGSLRDMMDFDPVEVDNIDELNRHIAMGWEFVAVDGDYWLIKTESTVL